MAFSKRLKDIASYEVNPRNSNVDSFLDICISPAIITQEYDEEKQQTRNI